MANTYRNQREPVPVPHVSLGDARRMAQLTLAQVCERYSEVTGKQLTRGALSGIENGHRRASRQLLDGLEQALDLTSGAIDTQYEPRMGRTAA